MKFFTKLMLTLTALMMSVSSYAVEEIYSGTVTLNVSEPAESTIENAPLSITSDGISYQFAFSGMTINAMGKTIEDVDFTFSGINGVQADNLVTFSDPTSVTSSKISPLVSPTFDATLDVISGELSGSFSAVYNLNIVYATVPITVKATFSVAIPDETSDNVVRKTGALKQMPFYNTINGVNTNNDHSSLKVEVGTQQVDLLFDQVKVALSPALSTTQDINLYGIAYTANSDTTLITIEDQPIEFAVDQFVFPVDVKGTVNATVDLSGETPVVDGTLNYVLDLSLFNYGKFDIVMTFGTSAEGVEVKLKTLEFDKSNAKALLAYGANEIFRGTEVFAADDALLIPGIHLPGIKQEISLLVTDPAYSVDDLSRKTVKASTAEAYVTADEITTFFSEYQIDLDAIMTEADDDGKQWAVGKLDIITAPNASFKEVFADTVPPRCPSIDKMKVNVTVDAICGTVLDLDASDIESAFDAVDSYVAPSDTIFIHEYSEDSLDGIIFVYTDKAGNKSELTIPSDNLSINYGTEYGVKYYDECLYIVNLKDGDDIKQIEVNGPAAAKLVSFLGDCEKEMERIVSNVGVSINNEMMEGGFEVSETGEVTIEVTGDIKSIQLYPTFAYAGIGYVSEYPINIDLTDQTSVFDASDSASNRVIYDGTSIIVLGATSEQITVLNAMGQVVAKGALIGGKKDAALSSGIYAVDVDGKIQKMIVK